MPNTLSLQRPLPNLRELGIDLNGHLVVPGTMTFPADDAGFFPRMETGHLRLSRLWGLRLAPCQAIRETSGFIQPNEVGSELSIPGELVGFILGKLQYGEDGRYERTLPFDSGYLESAAWPNSKNSQPLSHWTLVIEISEDWMKVSLSAKLHTENLYKAGFQGNFWTEQDGATVEATFEIDPITRAAYFGKSPTSGLTGAEPIGAPRVSNLNSLDISNTTIGIDSRILGASGSRWVQVYWNENPASYIHFAYYLSASRTDQGFLSLSDPIEPSIRSSCISMDTIQNIVRNSNSAIIEFHEGEFGIASYGGSSGSKWEVIRYIRLSIILNEHGLHFSYAAHASYIETSVVRKLDGEFSLAWEVLILRLPRMAQLRSRFESFGGTSSSAPMDSTPLANSITTAGSDVPMRSGKPPLFFRRLLLK